MTDGPNVVIMVWKQFLDAGFGDMLRGTIHLFNMSRRLNFRLIVDTQLHPVSKLLIPHPHMYSNYVLEHQSEITTFIGSTEILEHTIKTNLRGDKPLLVSTNVYPDESSITNDCKRFMRYLLRTNNEFNKYFIEMRNKFHITDNYAIIHFRLGDHELIRDLSSASDSNDDDSRIDEYNKLYGILYHQMSKVPNLYIMSDSLEFKKYLLYRRIRPERIIPTTPIHLSHPDAAMNVENIKETMFDFMLLANARVVKTHSKYDWVSNFVKWTCRVHNVPVVNIKPSEVSMKLSVSKIMNLPVEKHNAPVIKMPSFSKPLAFRKMF